MSTQKTAIYAIYEVTPNDKRLQAIFPEGMAEEAIEWGDSEFDEFSAARSGNEDTGEAYLSKSHGVHIGVQEVPKPKS